MPRYKITLEYDGSGFSGWQKQPELESIQKAMEDAVFGLAQERTEVLSAGRTDAGVHARGQVAHFDISKELDEYNVMQGLNFHLGEKLISVLKAEIVDHNFHARFSAKRRFYQYRIINRSARLTLDAYRGWRVTKQLDIYKMREAAGFLIGKHDFTSFRSTECQAASPIKTLEKIKIEKDGETIHLLFAAPSFLHNMVRNIVGTLKLVGEGKWQVSDVRKALEAHDRREAGPTAPPYGLYFMGVEY